MNLLSNSRSLLALGAAVFAFAAAGCGGGGSGPGPTTPTAIAPTPTPPPPPQTGVNVVVQLRDTTGAIVNGLVTLDGRRRATTGGDASFLDVTSGTLTASAEVNGTTYSQSFAATLGANTVQIAIAPPTTTPPGGNPPPPPAL